MQTLAPASIGSRQTRAATRGQGAGESRSVACDPAAHQICILDEDGRLLEVFGERGELPGQFDCPSDVIVVTPRFDEEEGSPDRLELLAVADRGNHRVQVFEPEGQLVALIGGDATHASLAASGGREGWPFFRLRPHAALPDPAQLRWEDPWLVVVDRRGAETRVDLAEALLPSFDEWLAAASRPMLAAAHHHFRHKARGESLPGPLAAIETALGCALLDANDLDAAARLWSLGWTAQTPATVRGAHIAARDHAAMRAAFRLGGAGPLSRVRAAIRLSVGALASWPDVDRTRSGRETREAS